VELTTISSTPHGRANNSSRWKNASCSIFIMEIQMDRAPQVIWAYTLENSIRFRSSTNPPLQQTRIKAQTMRTGDAIRLLGVFVTTRPGKYCTIT
jgi:hypothetical protein